MPFKRLYKRKRPNRPGRARKRRFRKRAYGPSAVVSTTSPLPDRFFTKMKYSHLGTITTTSGTAPYLFNMGNLYDPDRTGTGHQPFGRDQFATLYNKYRVYGCKYVITFTNTSSAYNADVAVVLKPVTTTSTDMQTVAEKPYVQFRSIGMNGSAAAKTVIKGYCHNAKILGVSKLRYSLDDEYTATAGVPPAEEPYLHIYARERAGTSGIVIGMAVQLTYYVVWYDRVALAGS